MTRLEELQALEALVPPKALEGAVTRAKARRARRRGKVLGVPIASLAGAAAALVLLINTSVPFALACGQIPFLKPLTVAAAWDDSLKTALKNDYYQVLDQTYTKNGVTLKLYCAVVDDRQVYLFLSVDKGHASDVKVFDAQGTPLTWSGILFSLDAEPGDLSYFSMDFGNLETPQNLRIGYQVSDETGVLADFLFDLTLDDRYFATARTVALGREMELDGQRFTLDQLTLSPTYAQLDFSANPANTAWLTGLDFYLEDERGTRYDSSVNGVSSLHSPGNKTPFYDCYRVESPYFSSCEHLTLRITRARWLDKEKARVTLDLKNHRAENLPDYVLNWSAQRKGTDWELTFEAEENVSVLPFLSYDGPYDTDGIGCMPANPEENRPFTLFQTIKDCPEDVVTLSLSYNRIADCPWTQALY